MLGRDISKSDTVGWMDDQNNRLRQRVRTSDPKGSGTPFWETLKC